MNFRTTYIFFGILILLIGVFALSNRFGTKPGQEGYLLADLHRADVAADAIDSIEIARHEPKAEKLVFVQDKEQKHWRMAEPYAARADSDLVAQAVRSVINAHREEKADLTPDLQKFGLASPRIVATLKQGDRQWTLNLGKESAGGSEALVYATSSADPKMPAAVRRSDLDSLLKPAKEYLSRDLLADSGDFGASGRTQSVILQEPKHDPVVLDKTAEERWRFSKPPYGDADYEGEPATGSAETKPITGVRELLNDIDGIRVDSADDFVAFNVSDLAHYGLEAGKPERLRIELKRKPASPPGEEGKTPKEPGAPLTRTLLIGKKAEADKLYARLDGENNVVRVSAKSVDPIIKASEDPQALRNRDLVDIDRSKANALDIQNASGALKLRKVAGAWKLYETGKPRSTDASSVESLLDALTAKRLAKSFPDPAKEADYGFDKSQAVVSLWTDGLADEKKDEAQHEASEKKSTQKKDEKAPIEAEPKLKSATPTVRLTFGKKDNALVYVRRETASGKTILSIPDSVLTQASEGPLAYLDRTLPSPPPAAEVSMLTIERGGETLQAERAKKDEKSPAAWKLTRPPDVVGRQADAATMDRIVADLRGLRAEKLVAENPSATELERYGLQKPDYQATLRILNPDGKKTDDWIYAFGKQSTSPPGRYAKESRSSFVFVAPAHIATALAGELLDPAVFHFDITRVMRLKLSGWKQAVGSTYTLEMERTRSTPWHMKTPSDFDLEPDQAQAFVARLAVLKAKRFLRKNELHPDPHLGPTDRAMQVEATLEGEKSALTLSIGGLDTKDQAYYAQASTLPGSLFLIPKAEFEPLLAGPKYFSKSNPQPR